MTADIERYKDWEITLERQHDAAMPWRATARRITGEGITGEGSAETVESEGVNRDCALAMVVCKIDRTT
jgi:hypothetical protein